MEAGNREATTADEILQVRCVLYQLRQIEAAQSPIIQIGFELAVEAIDQRFYTRAFRAEIEHEISRPVDLEDFKAWRIVIASKDGGQPTLVEPRIEEGVIQRDLVHDHFVSSDCDRRVHCL